MRDGEDITRKKEEYHHRCIASLPDYSNERETNEVVVDPTLAEPELVLATSEPADVVVDEDDDRSKTAKPIEVFRTCDM